MASPFHDGARLRRAAQSAKRAGVRVGKGYISAGKKLSETSEKVAEAQRAYNQAKNARRIAEARERIELAQILRKERLAEAKVPASGKRKAGQAALKFLFKKKSRRRLRA